MRKYIVLLISILFLFSCDEKDNTIPQQGFVFGLQLQNHYLDLSYWNIKTSEVTNISLPIRAGSLFQGVYDKLDNYYAVVGDTIFEVDINEHGIRRRFNCPDSIFFIFKDNDRDELIGINIVNDTVNIYKHSVATGLNSLIKTSLLSTSERFVTNVAYNSTDKKLFIQFENKIHVVDIDNSQILYSFDLKNVIHGLRYSKRENLLYFIEFLNGDLIFRKIDLEGNEMYSKKLDLEITWFYADNFVIAPEGDYLFMAGLKDKEPCLISISGEKLTQNEISNYEMVFGFSYMNK